MTAFPCNVGLLSIYQTKKERNGGEGPFSPKLTNSTKRSGSLSNKLVEKNVYALQFSSLVNKRKPFPSNLQNNPVS